MNADSMRINEGEFITAEGFMAVVVPKKDGIVELQYYDSLTNNSYRSWKISLRVLRAVCSFWQSYRSGFVAIPAAERVAEGEFRMLSEKFVYIRETDLYGNLKMIGADLPVALVESLWVLNCLGERSITEALRLKIDYMEKR